MTLASAASQAIARDCPVGRAAHKWKVFRWATEAREALGVTDRALCVLNALLTFLPDTAMTAGPELTVFPSNAQLSLRAHGMSESTLRRGLQALVDAGLVIRRDSPNGKRYARRSREGEVEKAFGFDLTPLLARAHEIERLAEEVSRRRRAAAIARERITVLRRDISKMIAAGIEGDVPADWPDFHRAFVLLCSRLPRVVAPETLERLAADLLTLAVQVGKLLEIHINLRKMTGNDSQSDAHFQNSKTNNIIDLNQPSDKAAPEIEPLLKEKRTPQVFPLGMILRACPDVEMYTRNGINGWPDLIAAAGTVRGALGISSSAWDEARKTMGDVEAAITIAGILQRAEEIKSAGGYLRNLTEKSRVGRFSTGPMIMALMQRQAHRSGPKSPGSS